MTIRHVGGDEKRLLGPHLVAQQFPATWLPARARHPDAAAEFMEIEHEAVVIGAWR